MEATDFIGLSKKSGQDLAESKNMVFRLISIDNEPFFSYPADERQDRICVEIKDGKIVVAKIT
jgi:hypothetical protein